MAGIRLDWAQFGDFDSFSIYKSNTPMAANSLPTPKATGVGKTSFWDSDVIAGQTYYYRVQVVRGAEVALSDELIALAAAGASDEFFTMVSLLVLANAESYPSTNIIDRSSRQSLLTSIPSNSVKIVSDAVTSPKLDEGSISIPTDASLVMPINGTQDYRTLEFFIKRGSGLVENTLRISPSKPSEPYSNDFGLYNYAGGGTLDLAANGRAHIYGAKTTFPVNKWVHICIQEKVNSDTDYQFFYHINGVFMGSSYSQSRILQGWLMLSGSNYFISSLRVTDGLLRYATNVKFTPPTEPFPAQ